MIREFLVIAALSTHFASFAEDVVEQYQQTRQKFSEEEQQHRHVLGSLYNINKKMKTMSSQRGKMTDKVLVAKTDVQMLARTIAKLEDTVQDQRGLLSSRLRVLYRLNAPSVLSLIFSSASSTELDRNIKALKRIADRDYKLIKGYEKNLNKLRVKRLALKGKVERLLSLQMQLKKQEQMLTVEQNSKSKILQQLKHDQEKTLSHMKNLKAKAEYPAIFDSAFFEKKGNLTPPVLSNVTKNYGFIEDEQFRFRLSHKGYFYALAMGVEIHSVFDGQVVFADLLPGYGKTVIVDHGDHYFTLYAYASQLKVKVGDKIQEGQLIAEAGYGMHHDRTGLYFEIRHFSDAIDPQGWIKDTKTESFRASQL